MIHRLEGGYFFAWGLVVSIWRPVIGSQRIETIGNILQNAYAVVVAICQFLAMIVIVIGIVKALKVYFADVLTHGRSAAAVR